MKAGKQILKWSLITIIAFTTFNGFISGKIESSIEINAPIEQVYFKVIDLQSWSTWAVWWERDSTMITKYSGEVAGKEFRNELFCVYSIVIFFSTVPSS